MPERSLDKEFEFPAVKNYNSIDYELGEITPNGTAIYIASANPTDKKDWPIWIEVDLKGEVISSNLK